MLLIPNEVITFSEPRKHHYVPVTYLRNFCIPNYKSERIFVFDKIKGKTFKPDIKDVAVEKDFYRLLGKEDEFYWEKFYSRNIEPKYPSLVSELTTLCTLNVNNAIILNVSIKEELSFIMCTQLLRTKKARENLEKVCRDAGNKKVKELRFSLLGNINQEQKEWMDRFELTDDLIREFELLIINDFERLNKFQSYFLNRHWILYYNKRCTDLPFKTSDHPVCYYNIISEGTGFRDNGIGHRSTVIFFPITPKILIALYPQPIYFGGLNEFDDRMICVDDEKFIKFVNDIQISQSYRQVFSSAEF